MMRAVEAHSCRRHSPAGQCGAPFFCALDALAINDRSARAGVPPRQLPACHIERVVNAPERAVVVPSVEVVVQGAARRQVLGDIAVGTLITERPPHRSEHALLTHSAPTSSM